MVFRTAWNMNTGALPHTPILIEDSVFGNGTAVHIQSAVAFKFYSAAAGVCGVIGNHSPVVGISVAVNSYTAAPYGGIIRYCAAEHFEVRDT